MQLDHLLRALVSEGVSDIHLRCGHPPMARKAGRLARVGQEPVEPAVIEEFLPQLRYGLGQMVRDGSYALDERLRFRVHAFHCQSQWALVLRVIPARVQTLGELGLPKVYEELAQDRRGLVLIGGEARSGRSTTLSAMIRTINESRACHLVVIEEPIEHLYRDSKASITQIEVPIDSSSWENALEVALRFDADVIALGHFRGERLISLALEAAERGMLVLAVAEGANPSAALRELGRQVGESRQAALWAALGAQFRAVLCQRLVPGVQDALLPICEALTPSSRVQEALSRGQLGKLQEILLEDDGQEGMQSFDRHLLERVEAGLVSGQTALGFADRKYIFEQRSYERWSGAP